MSTGVGFFDHMLDLLARHGRLGLTVSVQGDLGTGAHHTVEDTGIVLGQALGEALGDRRGIRRYGHAVVPMDEARAACAIDISGRPYCSVTGLDLPAGAIAGFEHEAAEEFFRAVASAARLTLHLELQAGTNAHHMIEACFKAFARALRAAVVDRPGRDRRAVDQGDARRDRRARRLRDGQPAQRREGARARRGARRADRRPRRRSRAADAIVLPGVGAFPEAMRRLRALGLDDLLRERADAGVPVLGICLGMQLLFESSDRARGRRGPRAARAAP